MTRYYCFIVTVVLIWLNTFEAFIQLPNGKSAHVVVNRAASGSYEEMLRKARERRGQPQQPNPSDPALKKEATADPPRKVAPQVQQALVSSSPPKKPNKDGLPFDDDMYKHLKFVIEKITARLRSENALSAEDVKKLETSINAILTDNGFISPAGMSYSDENSVAGDVISPTANSVQVPREMSIDAISTKSTSSANTQKATDFVAESFDSLKGIGSTWNLVPNIDKLTTEEYYGELNKKLAEIRRRLDSEGLTGTGKGNDYLDNLNSRKPKN